MLNILNDDYRDPEFAKKYERSRVVKLEKGEHNAMSLKVASGSGD
jgi:hypothetical protein